VIGSVWIEVPGSKCFDRSIGSKWLDRSGWIEVVGSCFEDRSALSPHRNVRGHTQFHAARMQQTHDSRRNITNGHRVGPFLRATQGLSSSHGV
jgi:hypothetical protein